LIQYILFWSPMMLYIVGVREIGLVERYTQKYGRFYNVFDIYNE
jgi:hypothetical protein